MFVKGKLVKQKVVYDDDCFQIIYYAAPFGQQAVILRDVVENASCFFVGDDVNTMFDMLTNSADEFDPALIAQFESQMTHDGTIH